MDASGLQEMAVNFVWKSTARKLWPASKQYRRRHVKAKFRQASNHLGSIAPLCAKDKLFAAMHRYFVERGEDPFLTVPPTFVVLPKRQEPSKWAGWPEFQQAFRRYAELLGCRNMWLIKPSSLNRGIGIQVEDTYEAMESFLAKKGNKASMGQMPVWLVQKYVENPMLYDNRKFDLRLWVLADDDGSVYVYGPAYLRTSSEEFRMDVTDRFVHLTNYCQQVHNPRLGEFEEGNTASMDDLAACLGSAFWPRVQPQQASAAALASMPGTADDVPSSHIPPVGAVPSSGAGGGDEITTSTSPAAAAISPDTAGSAVPWDEKALDVLMQAWWVQRGLRVDGTPLQSRDAPSKTGTSSGDPVRADLAANAVSEPITGKLPKSCSDEERRLGMVLLWGRGGVWDRMCELVRDTFRALHVDKPSPAHAAGCKEWGFGHKPAASERQRFELLGYDFMVDSNLNLWLIEVNTNPSLTYQNSWHKRQVDVMVDRLVTIVADPWFPAVAAPESGPAGVPPSKTAATRATSIEPSKSNASKAGDESSDEDAEDVDDGIIVSDNDDDIMDGHASDEEYQWWNAAEDRAKKAGPRVGCLADALGRTLAWADLQQPLLLAGQHRHADVSALQKGKSGEVVDPRHLDFADGGKSTADEDADEIGPVSPSGITESTTLPWPGALGLSPIMRAQWLLPEPAAEPGSSSTSESPEATKGSRLLSMVRGGTASMARASGALPAIPFIESGAPILADFDDPMLRRAGFRGFTLVLNVFRAPATVSSLPNRLPSIDTASSGLGPVAGETALDSAKRKASGAVRKIANQKAPASRPAVDSRSRPPRTSPCRLVSPLRVPVEISLSKRGGPESASTPVRPKPRISSRSPRQVDLVGDPACEPTRLAVPQLSPRSRATALRTKAEEAKESFAQLTKPGAAMQRLQSFRQSKDRDQGRQVSEAIAQLAKQAALRRDNANIRGFSSSRALAGGVAPQRTAMQKQAARMVKDQLEQHRTQSSRISAPIVPKVSPRGKSSRQVRAAGKAKPRGRSRSPRVGASGVRKGRQVGAASSAVDPRIVQHSRTNHGSAVQPRGRLGQQHHRISQEASLVKVEQAARLTVPGRHDALARPLEPDSPLHGSQKKIGRLESRTEAATGHHQQSRLSQRGLDSLGAHRGRDDRQSARVATVGVQRSISRSPSSGTQGRSPFTPKTASSYQPHAASHQVPAASGLYRMDAMRTAATNSSSGSGDHRHYRGLGDNSLSISGASVTSLHQGYPRRGTGPAGSRTAAVPLPKSLRQSRSQPSGLGRNLDRSAQPSGAGRASTEAGGLASSLASPIQVRIAAPGRSSALAGGFRVGMPGGRSQLP